MTPFDIEHLQRRGKEHLLVVSIAGNEMHEDDAAHVLSAVLMGKGVAIEGEHRQGGLPSSVMMDCASIAESAGIHFVLSERRCHHWRCTPIM